MPSYWQLDEEVYIYLHYLQWIFILLFCVYSSFCPSVFIWWVTTGASCQSDSKVLAMLLLFCTVQYMYNRSTYTSSRLNDNVEIGAVLSFALFPRIPLMATRTLFSKLNRNLVRMYPITSAYRSFLFSEMRVAILLWNIFASFPNPPKVDITIGVKEPFSICRTLSLYAFFFSLSWDAYTLSMGVSI